MKKDLKALSMPEGTSFIAARIRAGVQLMLQDAGECGPAMERMMAPLEEKGANTLVRASVPGFPNHTAAEALHRALNLPYDATGIIVPYERDGIFFNVVPKLVLDNYRGKFGNAEVLGIFHLELPVRYGLKAGIVALLPQ